MSKKIDTFLKGCIEQNMFTGISYAYQGKEGKLTTNYIGTLGHSKDNIKEDTLFDMASCTKIFVSLAFMRLLEEGRIALTDTVERYLPSWKGYDTGKITMVQLLTHTSMLPSHLPLYRMCNGKDGAIEIIKHLYPRSSQGVEYSCLGFIVLGWVLEKAADMTLDQVIEVLVCAPLGMNHTLYCPDFKNNRNIIATENCKWRQRLLVGEVHDENAFHLGGISGNAGIFSTINDICLMAEAMLSGVGYGGKQFHKKETIAIMTKNYTSQFGENRGLGWCLKSLPDNTAGDYFTDNSFGHTGFTGTSIWIDINYNFYAILLSNRVFYTRDYVDIRHVRQIFHNLAMLEYLHDS